MHRIITASITLAVAAILSVTVQAEGPMVIPAEEPLVATRPGGGRQDWRWVLDRYGI